MIQTDFFNTLTVFIRWFLSTSLFNISEFEYGYYENLRTVTVDEIALRFLTSNSNSKKYLLDNSIVCLHNNPNFQKFLMERPYFKIKYHRKRSKKYHYIDPTITR